MGFMSRITGGGKQSHTVPIEIRADQAVADAIAGAAQGPGSAVQALVLGALAPLGDRIENIEIHLAPLDGDLRGRMTIVMTTTKLSDVEKAEFEARAAECLQQVGSRLR